MHQCTEGSTVFKVRYFQDKQYSISKAIIVGQIMQYCVP